MSEDGTLLGGVEGNGTHGTDGTHGARGVLVSELDADAVLVREERIVIGTQDPSTMKLSEVRAELKALPLPADVINKARQNMDRVNAMVEEQRAELRILQGDAQAAFNEADQMAERIRLRRKALAEAASAAEKQQSDKAAKLK